MKNNFTISQRNATVRLRTRYSHILRWAVGALDWYHSIWILNYSLDDYFNRADCKPDLLPALRAFGKPLRAVCLLRTEQLQTTQVCMFSGIEKPSSLTDRASDRPICFHCTIYCLFHAYLSFLIPEKVRHQGSVFPSAPLHTAAASFYPLPNRRMHQIRLWCLSAADGNQISLFLKRP